MIIGIEFNKVFSEYFDAHTLSEPVYEQGVGLTSEGDFTYFESFIEDAWETYQTKDADTQKELDEIASQIFGFSRMTFREFVGEYSKYRTDFILGSFPPNADIIGENDDDDEIDWQFILSQ